MEKLGYEKVLRISLAGFVILSIIIMVVVNIYFSEASIYERSKEDIKISGDLMAVTNKINEAFKSFDLSLRMQTNFIQDAFNTDISDDFTQTDMLVYDEAYLVSITDPSRIEKYTANGSVVVKGTPTNLTDVQITQLNQLRYFYEDAEVMFLQKELNHSIIYYSVEDFLVYYPFKSNQSSVIAYYGVFESVKEIASQIYSFSEEEQEKAIRYGWYQTNVNKDSNITTINKTYPVISDDQITGLVVGYLTEEDVSDILTDMPKSLDVYLINNENKVVYSSLANVEKDVDFGSWSESYYDVKFYNNQFPLPIEVREEQDSRFYISEVAQNGWQIIAVSKEDFIATKGSMIVFDVFMILFMALILFIGYRYGSKQRNKLAEDAKKSKFDSMTELLNHANIIRALALYMSNRRIRQISVMMIDIDHFKLVNDNYGHSVGDDVIIVTARTIEAVLNNYVGVVGRYGGEEFMVALPRIDKELVFELAERIRTTVSEHIKETVDLDITISVGVHFQNLPAEISAEELIDLADKNLYEAKETGRNKVVKTEG